MLETINRPVVPNARIRTGIWYDDRQISLDFPESSDVLMYRPNTPLPMTDEDLRDALNHPVGQEAIHVLARNRKRPIVVVDDLARPTPVFRILPLILEQFRMAGLSDQDVRIIVATGTHGEQNREALGRKIGKEVMDRCRVIVHDEHRGNRYIGKTSFGTPVYVNNEVLGSDLKIGIGGVYPQHTTGFGGGSKLALGVLGRKSIMYLHYGHKGVGGNYEIDNSFRKDMMEIASMIELKTICTVHIDEDLEVVHFLCGDHFLYFPRAARISRTWYSAPPPGDADVVISNAYPFDVSFTFMRKAYKPLDLADSGATKIMIASNHEGIGVHGFFPHMDPPRLIKYRQTYERVSMMKPKDILWKIWNRLRSNQMERKGKDVVDQNYVLPKNTGRLLLYIPHRKKIAIPAVDGIFVTRDWTDILEIVRKEHSQKKSIKIRMYSCAPIQCLETGPA